jgi:WD40 repeat protein
MKKILHRPSAVFISYSRTDLLIAERLDDMIRALGLATLRDLSDIAVGEEWQPRLDALIQQASAVVFLISPSSISSPICEWEVNRTLELCKRLIPVVVRKTSLSSAPPVLARLQAVSTVVDTGRTDGDQRLKVAAQLIKAAVEVDVAWVREHTRIVGLAARWDSAGRPKGQLLRSSEINEAQSWIQRRSPSAPQIPAVVFAFLRASLEKEEEDRAALRAREIEVAAAAQRLIASLAREANEVDFCDRAMRLALWGWPRSTRDGEAAPLERLLENQLARGAFSSRLLRRVTVDGSPPTSAEFSVYSPDGGHVAVSGGSKVVIWTSDFEQVVCELPTGTTTSNGVCFSPDSRRFLYRSADDRISVYDLVSRKALCEIEGWQYGRHGYPFSPDGAYIVVENGHEVKHPWEIEWVREMRLIRVCDGSIAQSFLGPRARYTNELLFTRDGQFLLACGEERLVMWNVAATNPVWAIDAERGRLGCMALSPDERWLAVGHGSGGVSIYDFGTRELALHIPADPHAARVAFGHGGRMLAAMGANWVRVWDVATWEEVMRVADHEGFVSWFAWSPDDELIATVGEDHQAFLYSVSARRRVHQFLGHEQRLRTVAFSPGGQELVTSGWDETVRCWDIRNAPSLVASYHSPLGLSAAAVSPDGQTFAAAREDGSVLILDSGTLEPRTELEARDQIGYLPMGGTMTNAFSLEYAPDGRRLVVSYASGSALVWDLPARDRVHELRGHSDLLLRATYACSGKRIVTSSRDYHREVSVIVWDAETGQEVRRFVPSEEEPRIWALRGGWICIRRKDGDWALLDPSGFDQIGELPGWLPIDDSSVICPVTNRIVASSYDDLYLFAISTGREIGRAVSPFRGYNFISELAFSPDGRRFVSTGRDGGAAIWDSETGELLGKLRTDKSSVGDPAFTADGQTLVLPCGSGLLAVHDTKWVTSTRLAGAELARHVCAELGNRIPEFTARESLQMKRILGDETVSWRARWLGE